MALNGDNHTVPHEEKHVIPTEEKHLGTEHPHLDSEGNVVGQWREKEDFMTRNGLNLKSFQRRPAGEQNELDKSMKTRHLHMIAIGGSIGAGFFVGSGNALRQGVSL